jgi:hypothetical protein
MNLAEMRVQLEGVAEHHAEEERVHHALADSHTKQALDHAAKAAETRALLRNLRQLDPAEPSGE